MRIGVVLLDERFDRIELGEIDTVFFGKIDIVSAAIESEAGLDADEASASGRRFVLRDLEAAHHAPAVQALLLQAHFIDIVSLFLTEIPLHEQLAGEVVVTRERAYFAFRA